MKRFMINSILQFQLRLKQTVTFRYFLTFSSDKFPSTHDTSIPLTTAVVDENLYNQEFKWVYPKDQCSLHNWILNQPGELQILE